MKKITYKPLFKLLIDRNMTRTDLKRLTGISPGCLAKLGKGDNLTTDVLVRICNSLDCTIPEIMELEDEK